MLLVIAQWVASGFGGNLDQQRLLFLGVIFLVNGVQLGTAFYLLKHHGAAAASRPDSAPSRRNRHPGRLIPPGAPDGALHRAPLNFKPERPGVSVRARYFS